MNKLPIVLSLIPTVLAGAAPVVVDTAFERAEYEWRETRAKRLASPNGWLTLVGLSWLHPGENTFGSDPEADVPLPEGKAPKLAGKLLLENGAVRLVAPADSVMLDGKPAGERVLRDDNQDETDVLKIGEVSFYVIKRGDKYGVRVKDPNSPVRTQFKGLDYFPVAPRWKVVATFKPYDAPRKVEIPTVLGTTDTMEAPGTVTFTVDGKEYTLEPVVEDPEHPSLWFIFKDATSTKETYGGGRFLYSGMPKDGKVEVDFNQAYNPPCAFTPYATCPLPPKQNWLPVRVEAGEKVFAGGHN